MHLSYQIIIFLAGVLILGVGAHYFVKSSCQIGVHLKMPPLVAGVMLVGFGGSFPEIVVSFIAAMHGQATMAVGNAVGSNIVNLGMVLGISALVAPIAVSPTTMKRDFPLLWVVMAVVYGLLWFTKQLNLLVGIILLVGLVIYLGFIIVSIKQNRATDFTFSAKDVEQAAAPLWRSLVVWLVGLGLLFVSSDMLVASASTMAHHFGMSDLLIGLTIVAIGTSLPEFATTVISAHKGHHDIALGNVLGSNIFNLLAVLAMPALFSPTSVARTVFVRDYPVMALLTLITMLGVILPKGARVIGRYTATLMVLVWIVYYYFLLKP